MEKYKLLSPEAKEGIMIKNEIRDLNSWTGQLKEGFTYALKMRDIVKLMDAYFLAMNISKTAPELNLTKLIASLKIDTVTAEDREKHGISRIKTFFSQSTHQFDY
jgi:hypothetical protein